MAAISGNNLRKDGDKNALQIADGNHLAVKKECQLPESTALMRG